MLANRVKKRLLPIVFTVFFASIAVAAVEPNAVIMYFLPAQDTSEVDSPHESKYTPKKTGIVISRITDDLPEKRKNDERHGIKTPVGVSLYEKGETPLPEAVENVLAPVKVMILPPENTKNGAKRTKVAGTPDSVVPLPIRIFPLTNPRREIEKVPVKRVRPLASVVTLKSEPKDDPRPRDEKEWADWVFRQLSHCEGNQKRPMLATLYRMLADYAPLHDKTHCEVKRDVAKFLQKCYPWPAVYYTPSKPFYSETDIQTVRMALEVLGSRFSTLSCPLDLTHINFVRNDFMKITLDDADLSYSNFDGADFLNASLKNAVLRGANLDNSNIRDSSFSGAYMKEAQMRFSLVSDSELDMVYFGNADLTDTQIRRSSVAFSDFSYAKLANTDWRDVNGRNVVFSNADLTKSVFDNVFMEKAVAKNADFSKLVCKDCVFQNAQMSEAQFYEGAFNTVTFKGANLTEANFDKARFQAPVVFDGAEPDGASFKAADIRALSGIAPETLRLTRIDSATIMPEQPEDFESASYDIDIFYKNFETQGTDAYGCTAKMCEDRLKGRASNTNLALRAMALIDAPNTTADEKMWGLCTMGCIARHDKKLEPSQIDILAEFVRKNAVWSTEDLFKPFTPLSPEVQAALYILTDPSAGLDPTYDVDLSGTDLRGADLTNSDLRAFTFKGANLSGANLTGALIDKSFERFDRAVVDQFTVFPKNALAFEAFHVPDDPARPRWWKPGRVRVIKDTVNLWYAVTESIPFSDSFIVSPLKENETAGGKEKKK